MQNNFVIELARSAKRSTFAELETRIPSWHRKRLLEQARSFSTSSEPELRFASLLKPFVDTFVDIGANEGMFSIMACEAGLPVVAFEPAPHLAKRISSAMPEVDVRRFALGNESGKTVTLVVPILDGHPRFTMSTIEPQQFSETVTFTAPVSRLDDQVISSDRVFLKIDVEGHEADVLEGAESTVTTKCKVALIEAEERHWAGATDHVVDWFESHGFTGWFIKHKTLISVDRFDQKVHQSAETAARIASWQDGPLDDYCNNFVFVRTELVDEFVTALGAGGFQFDAS